MLGLGDGLACPGARPSPVPASLGLAALKPHLAPALLTWGSCAPGRPRLNPILSSNASKRRQGFGSPTALVCRNQSTTAWGAQRQRFICPSPEVWASEIGVPLGWVSGGESPLPGLLGGPLLLCPDVASSLWSQRDPWRLWL